MSSFDMARLHTADVKEICDPLIKYFNVTAFSYLNIYSDLSRIHLDCNYEWNQYFYQHIDIFSADENLTESTDWEPGFSTLYSIGDPCIPHANPFGIGDGLVIANTLNDCTELCFIGSERKNEQESVSNMLNNIDLLQKFLLYFRDKASDLILKEKKQPIILPNSSNPRPKRKFSFNQETRLNFINSLKLSDKPITKREFECLTLLAKGMTSKEIGQELKINSKTGR